MMYHAIYCNILYSCAVECDTTQHNFYTNIEMNTCTQLKHKDIQINLVSFSCDWNRRPMYINTTDAYIYLYVSLLPAVCHFTWVDPVLLVCLDKGWDTHILYKSFMCKSSYMLIIGRLNLQFGGTFGKQIWDSICQIYTLSLQVC